MSGSRSPNFNTTRQQQQQQQQQQLVPSHVDPTQPARANRPQGPSIPSSLLERYPMTSGQRYFPMVSMTVVTGTAGDSRTMLEWGVACCSASAAWLECRMTSQAAATVVPSVLARQYTAAAASVAAAPLARPYISEMSKSPKPADAASNDVTNSTSRAAAAAAAAASPLLGGPVRQPGPANSIRVFLYTFLHNSTKQPV